MVDFERDERIWPSLHFSLDPLGVFLPLSFGFEDEGPPDSVRTARACEFSCFDLFFYLFFYRVSARPSILDLPLWCWCGYVINAAIWGKGEERG